VITALESSDLRRFELLVAGPAALLVSKLHKLGDRQDDGTRLDDKDAHDVYRLMRAVPTAVFAEKMEVLQRDPVAGGVTVVAVDLLDSLFGTPQSLGSSMAGRAEVLIGDPDVTSTAAASLALDLLEALGRSRTQ
jgi:hypothetical protein